MAEIRNYTMNFSSGRLTGLTCSGKLAFSEIHFTGAFGGTLQG